MKEQQLKKYFLFLATLCAWSFFKETAVFNK